MDDDFTPTHYGWVFGVVPVMVDMTTPEVPVIDVRHWAFEPLLDVCEAVHAFVAWLVTAVNPDFEPTFAIRLTGEVE